MKRIVGSMVVAALAAFAPAHAEAMVKCSVPSAPVVYVVDGRRVEESVARTVMRPEMVESIDVICSHEGHRVFGVEPRSNLVLVFTKAADRGEMLAAAMQSIVLAQEAHLAARGSFASQPDQLLWVNPGGAIQVTLQVSGEGARWTATGRHRGGGEPISVSGERPSVARAR